MIFLYVHSREHFYRIKNYFCSFLACSDFGSQVSSTPSLRNCRMSTWDRSTEVWTWQPFNFGICCSASFASSLSAALMESAIRVSSEWSLGFLLPRYSVFVILHHNWILSAFLFLHDNSFLRFCCFFYYSWLYFSTYSARSKHVFFLWVKNLSV